MKRILLELFVFNIIPFLFGMFIIPDMMIRKSIFYGWLIVFVSIGIGLVSFRLAKNKDSKSFIKYYFGGMIIRLLVLLVIIFAILKYIGISPISFLFSLFIFYIINQIVELRYITKSLSNK